MNVTCAYLVLTAVIGADFPCFCPQYEYYGTVGTRHQSICSAYEWAWDPALLEMPQYCDNGLPGACDCEPGATAAPMPDPDRKLPLEKAVTLEKASVFKGQSEAYAVFAVLADDDMKIKIQQILIQPKDRPAMIVWAAVEVDRFPENTEPIDLRRGHCSRPIANNQYHATVQPGVLRGKLGISGQPEFLILTSKEVPLIGSSVANPVPRTANALDKK